MILDVTRIVNPSEDWQIFYFSPPTRFHVPGSLKRRLLEELLNSVDAIESPIDQIIRYLESAFAETTYSCTSQL